MSRCVLLAVAVLGLSGAELGARQAADPLATHLLQDDTCADGISDDACGLSLRQLRGEKAPAPAESHREIHPAFLELGDAANSSVDESSGPPELTFYVYRAKNNENYEDTNVNMANLAGVMWYLHNEVVGHCPRKFGIVRVLRYKITMRNTPELKRSTGKNFARLCHFDSGACTGPASSISDFKFGFVVGCDKPSFHQAAYPKATWFSFPGSCPEVPFQRKTEWCKQDQKGGNHQCNAGEPWSKTCTWRLEPAGEVTLDELTHNKNFDNTCRNTGFFEYRDGCDCGQGTNFWHGKRDFHAGLRRMSWLKTLFQRNYPSMPTDLGSEPECEWGDPQR